MCKLRLGVDAVPLLVGKARRAFLAVLRRNLRRENPLQRLRVGFDRIVQPNDRIAADNARHIRRHTELDDARSFEKLQRFRVFCHLDEERAVVARKEFVVHHRTSKAAHFRECRCNAANAHALRREDLMRANQRGDLLEILFELAEDRHILRVLAHRNEIDLVARILKLWRECIVRFDDIDGKCHQRRRNVNLLERP